MQKLESVQYNASLAITGCFRGTSRDKLYSELGLESLADRRFYRRLIAFYKIVNKKAPQYFIDYLPFQDLSSINLRKRLIEAKTLEQNVIAILFFLTVSHMEHLG